MPPLLIRDGSLIDGTGRPARRADLRIEEGRISAIGPRLEPSPAERILEAAGLSVCPGFIDLHSHGDLVLALPPAPQRRLMEGRLSQGITTEIVGNCGLGVFPLAPEHEEALRGIVAWMTPTGHGMEPEPPGRWPWRDLASYLDHLDSQGTWVNVGALQPHGALRVAAAGPGRLASSSLRTAALRRMSPLLEAAMEAGAFGLSTGLIYPPGLHTPPDEIVALSRIVASRGGEGAFVASHIRGSSETLLEAVDELIQTAQLSGARVQHSHSEAVGPAHWRLIQQVLDREDSARGRGVRIAFDMFPYTAAATMMLAIYPPWALEQGVDGLLRLLADPASRLALDEAIRLQRSRWPSWQEGGWPHNLVAAVGWGRITIGSVGSERNRGLEGLSLSELGRLRNATPMNAISDLMIEEGGKVSQILHGVSGDDLHEEGLEALLAHPAGAVCTDANDFGRGRPHPAAAGAFARVLGRHVRQRRLLSLPEAVRKMTGYPAELLGLGDRGILQVGAAADLVVLDAGAIGSEASFDDPGRRADGIVWVIVNGAIVQAADGGGCCDRPPGRVLRRSG